MRGQSSMGWTIALTACILATVAFSAGSRRAAIGAGTASVQDTVRTTQSGVFTEDQANRGKQTFANICGSCHEPSSESGDAFDAKWKDHPLADLFTYIGTQMPQNDPGSLDPYVTIDVVAYMLKLNEMPSGTTELAPDTAALKTIRITRLKEPTP